MAYAWERADCYPAQRLSLHTIHTNLDAYRDTRSLSVISGLRLPYTPQSARAIPTVLLAHRLQLV